MFGSVRARPLTQAESAPPQLQGSLRAAAVAVAELEQATAQSAVDSVDFDTVEERLTKTIKVEGHLFDNAILNRLLDVAVDSPCSFEVSKLEVAPVNEATSMALIQLWGDTDFDLEETVRQIKDVVEENSAEDFSFEVL
jgi:homocitrate synthase